MGGSHGWMGQSSESTRTHLVEGEDGSLDASFPEYLPLQNELHYRPGEIGTHHEKRVSDSHIHDL